MRTAWFAMLCFSTLTACGPETLNRTNPLDRAILRNTEPLPGPARIDERSAATAKRNLLDELHRLPKDRLAVAEYLGQKGIECDKSIWQTGMRKCVREASERIVIFISVISQTDYRFDIIVEDWLDPEKTLQIAVSQKPLQAQ